jgi:hypothetical protein
MKKLLFLVLFVGATYFLMAQDKKPTKEQTIEYITNVLKDYHSDFSRGDGGYGTYKITAINFKEDNLTLKVDILYGSSDVKHYLEYVVDIKDVESVSIKNSSGMYFLNFNSFNAKKLIKSTATSIYDGKQKPPEQSFSAEIAIPSPNDEKLLKAFNHLRKLCGAPEPITF